MSAVISDCGKFRYCLTRPAAQRSPERSAAVFVMLNPSTADATIDDRTIGRCREFAETWDCNGVVVVNLYAYRATDPKDLKRAGWPIGPENDAWLQRVAKESDDVICAWGTNAQAGRAADVVAMLLASGIRLFHLGLTKDGHPRHPLYLRGDTKPTLWKEPK